MRGLTRRNALRWMLGASTLALQPVAMTRAASLLPYKDARAPIAMRVRDLMARMTLDEKVAQMTALWAGKAAIMTDGGLDFDAGKASRAFPDGIGQITRPSDRRGSATAPEVAGGIGARWRGGPSTIAFVNAVQRWARDRTRLGIPVLFHEEALHGYMAPGATMFPQAIALAGSFDRDLVHRVQQVVAREARAHGARLVLSPVVDIARDPRWGRIEETFGEDPYLCGEMGLAAVSGLQGDDDAVLAPGHVFATLKHMTGHGQPLAGNNIAPAPLGERELREFFFPPFRSIVAKSRIAAVMPSYNEIDGIPSHANHWLLSKVLRGEWGFEGAIVSDYGAIEDLVGVHHVAVDLSDAARRALHAGVDCDLPDGLAYRTLADQVRAGTIPLTAIDAACARMLTLKFRAGLFEDPFADPAAAVRLTGNDEARALALEAARRSLCLLTNDATLPLDAVKVRRVALIGPNAAVARLGGYSGEPLQTVSLADALHARLGGRLTVHQGVRITRSEDRSADAVELADPLENRRLIEEAVTAARGADVIILAIGDTEQISREGYAPNHLGDRTSLDLAGDQNALFEALHALGKPVVVCAINGRPPSWPAVAARAAAMLECWYPGQEGGTAIVEALLGDVNPGAKLPVTVARHVGQVPIYYNAKPSVGRGYLFDTTSPLFPFGHGLSYTTFRLGPPRLSARRIGRSDSVAVSVDVTNIGSRTGDEVVQLYLHDQLASVTRPIKELKGFERVTLAPGETRTVRFTLGPDAFSLWDSDMREVVEPGRFDIMTGPNSVELQGVVLEIS